MGKSARHEAILQLVRSERVQSQEQLRDLLAERSFEVTQATLSRDIRELGLVKVPGPDGRMYYTLPAQLDQTPPLRRLLSTLFVDADGTGNLLILKTLTAGAQPVAVALDAEAWPEILGTIAGDDTILVVLRDAKHLQTVTERIRDMVGT